MWKKRFLLLHIYSVKRVCSRVKGSTVTWHFLAHLSVIEHGTLCFCFVSWWWRCLSLFFSPLSAEGAKPGLVLITYERTSRHGD